MESVFTSEQYGRYIRNWLIAHLDLHRLFVTIWFSFNFSISFFFVRSFLFIYSFFVFIRFFNAWFHTRSVYIDSFIFHETLTLMLDAVINEVSRFYFLNVSLLLDFMHKILISITNGYEFFWLRYSCEAKTYRYFCGITVGNIGIRHQ